MEGRCMPAMAVLAAAAAMLPFGPRAADLVKPGPVVMAGGGLVEVVLAPAQEAEIQRLRVRAPPERQAFVRKVVGKLTSVLAPPELLWPPQVEILAVGVNAMAFEVRDASGRRVPVVAVGPELLDRIVQGEEARLAVIVGHELGHLLLGHTRPAVVRDQTLFVRNVFTREQEMQADSYGVALGLRAAYEREALLGGLKAMYVEFRGSPLESLGSDHPSWADRLAQVDPAKSELWRSIGEFANGVTFLDVGDYRLAARSFDEVARAFPGAWEVWSNLGYALLLAYVDGLRPEDVRLLKIAHPLLASYYTVPVSLEERALRGGLDQSLWERAVAALERARKLRPEAALPHANLGVAYLVQPAGPDAERAARLLAQAVERCATDSYANPIGCIAAAVNLAVAYHAAGRQGEFRQQLDAAEEEMQKLLRRAGLEGQHVPAIDYDRALAEAAGTEPNKRTALKRFERFVSDAPDSPWQPLAYARYADLARELGTAPIPEGRLRAAGVPQYRPVLSVEVAGGVLALGDGIEEVRKRLGGGEVVPTPFGSRLVHIRYGQHGLDLLATDRVVAIRLSGANAPPVTLQRVGVGGKPSVLRIGMKRSELLALVQQRFLRVQVLDERDVYFAVAGLGLGVRVREGTLTGMALVPPQNP